ncbi:MAG: hypothetical protein A2V90_06790 [Gammaproteobacteria bacterium RBG_16_57_12]|nr:MAG: hypothetical protein A2V90_06790 [Gammaproteobacteria bacterium RBG_16_57_12]
MEWGYSIAGLVVGFVVGLTGVGGGSLMTPLLIFVFNIPSAMAVGTDLLFASITKSGGVWVHHRHSTINWKIVLLLSAGSIPSALIAVKLLEALTDQGIDYKPLLNMVLGIALILTSISLFYRNRLQTVALAALAKAPDTLPRIRDGLTVVMGVVLGFLVTLSSVGAGALGAAVLTMLYPRLATIRIVGTDIAHAVPLTAIAGLGHMHLGTVNFALLINLLAGSLPGIYLGSHLGPRIPERVMRPILATALLLLGVKFILS